VAVAVAFVYVPRRRFSPFGKACSMRLAIFLVISQLICLVGCQKSDGLVPVEGVVALDGKPLAGVQVVFDQPELGPRENKGYIGRTDQQGHYSLRPSLTDGAGAPPGKFRVTLTTAVLDPNQPAAPPQPTPGGFAPDTPPPPPERIPPAYRDGKLSFTVPEGGTDKANFDLTSK
jgi:hypothetical protein